MTILKFAAALIWANLDKATIQLCHFLISHGYISHKPTFIVPFIFIKKLSISSKKNK